MNRSHPGSSRRSAGPGPGPAGYTLHELLIVLAILASIVAMAWPRVHPLLSRSSQHDAALQLAAELAEARERAIRTGQAQVLRVVPGTDCYALTSQGLQSNSAPRHPIRSSADADAPLTADPSTESEPRAAEQDELAHCRLAGGVIFAPSDPRSAENAAPAIALQPDALERDGADVALDLAADGLVAAQFFPDGRSTDSVIELTVPDARETVVIRLRGLTGGISIQAGSRSAERLEDGPAETREPVASRQQEVLR